MKIRGYKEFQDWLDANNISEQEKKNCSRILWGMLYNVRLKGNKDKIICSCKYGVYCNAECNL